LGYRVLRLEAQLVLRKLPLALEHNQRGARADRVAALATGAPYNALRLRRRLGKRGTREDYVLPCCVSFSATPKATTASNSVGTRRVVTAMLLEEGLAEFELVRHPHPRRTAEVRERTHVRHHEILHFLAERRLGVK
jgi:hypothetical protein